MTTVPKPTWAIYLWFTVMLICAELIGFIFAAVLVRDGGGVWAHAFSSCAVVFFVLATWLPSIEYITVLPTGHKPDEDVIVCAYILWMAACAILGVAWLMVTFNPWVVSAIIFIIGGLFVMVILATGPDPEVA